MSREKQHKLCSYCCISHEFCRVASNNPNKVAVVHASGGALIARAFRRRTSASVSDVDYDSFFGSVAPSPPMSPSHHPPLYRGDRTFTFAEILSAVDSLSARLRRVLEGGDDPNLVRPTAPNDSGSFSCKWPVHAGISDVSMSSNPNLEQDTYNPKIVGLYIVPSVDYIIAVLSVLRCGEAFIPLNPLWPGERISSILSSSNAILVIRCQSYFGASGCYDPDKSQELVDISRYPQLFISINGGPQQQCGLLNLAWPCETEKSRMFCYLMYTSGSTGKPKGVCGSEIGLLNRFVWMQEAYPLVGEEMLLFKTPISFIDHLQEFLGALLSASTLIIPPFNEIEENQFYLYDFLQAYSINRLIAVPSLIKMVLPLLEGRHSTRVQNSLKLIVLSGEVFPLSLWRRLHECLPKTSILNLYGSTEVSGDCSCFDCKNLPSILEFEELDSVPIGMPISNCALVLAGEDSQAEGEIYVGGLGTAAGYFDNLSIVFDDFVELPKRSSNCPNTDFECQYYFKTGDFARRLQSGDLIFRGRRDRIVKVNGQRFGLDEIEVTLRGHQDVVDAVVIYCGREEMAFLEAYVIIRSDAVSQNWQYSLRSWMLGKLPLAMIPNCLFSMKAFPMSSSGKVDYDSLANLTSSVIRERSASGRSRSSEYLQVIKKVFSDALMVEMVSDDDDFFKLGGNSISAAHVSHNLGIDMRMLYVFPSPVSLHTALIEKEGFQVLPFKPTNMETLLVPLHSEVPTRCSTKSSRRISRTLYSKNDDYFSKCQKIDSSFDGNSNAVNILDGHPWKFCFSKMACSIGRGNKVFHVGVHEGHNISQLSMSVDITRDIRGVMRESWKVNLEACVDASPLVVFKDQEILLFIGSHSCKFFCIDVKSGAVHWEIKLEGRIECSAAILDNFLQVVVGCYRGNIYFLDIYNGDILWNFGTSGEVKSQPVVDPCRHLVWCGSYDHNLYGLDYISHCCVYKFACGGSVFGSPVIDEVRDALYVASTSGRVTKICVKALPFGKLWVQELRSPIFGSLSISVESGIVVCCLVDGYVVALNSNGTVFWKVKAGGPIFAGPCLSHALTSQVLICSRDGSIYSFALENGSLLWQYNVEDPITSSAYIDENLVLVSDPYICTDRLVCVCSSNGSIHLLRVPSERKWLVENGVQTFAKLDLPGDIFSSPLMIGGQIFVGCRDDYVHCLMLETPCEIGAVEDIS